MAAVKTFEELVIWQMARSFSRQTSELIFQCYQGLAAELYRL